MIGNVMRLRRSVEVRAAETVVTGLPLLEPVPESTADRGGFTYSFTDGINEAAKWRHLLHRIREFVLTALRREAERRKRGHP